jgi:enamine deaminase RidA (YjgF/YER057c/UK114 family)
VKVCRPSQGEFKAEFTRFINKKSGPKMNIFLNPASVHPPLAGYSHQVVIPAFQRWLVISGQVGMKLDGALPEDPLEQFEIALDNISRNLEAAHMGIGDIVKLTIYLVDHIDTAKRREAISSWLQGHVPCMTLVYVAALAAPNLKVEIEALACA